MLKILIEIIVQVLHDNIFFGFFSFFRLDTFRPESYWPQFASFDEPKYFLCAPLCFLSDGDLLMFHKS